MQEKGGLFRSEWLAQKSSSKSESRRSGARLPGSGDRAAKRAQYIVPLLQKAKADRRDDAEW